MSGVALWTIGHSSRSAAELCGILAEHEIVQLVDIRAFPGSRRQPWFGGAALAATLDEAGIAYRHVSALGGRRRQQPGTRDADVGAWRNDSFRAYAQWTRSAGFGLALHELLEAAALERTAIMCSEAVPWRCHRWLVSDCATARGVEVLHLIDDGPARLHLLSPFAVTDDDGNVRWPGPVSTEPLRVGPRVTSASAGRSTRVTD
jgi:uncharacterized protein (DUF488 family)